MNINQYCILYYIYIHIVQYKIYNTKFNKKMLELTFFLLEISLSYFYLFPASLIH